MLDAVSRLAESEQRAWVSEVERTVQQRQMLSKAQEVSQAIGAEMRRAREAIIAEYGPGVFDSAAASGASTVRWGRPACTATRASIPPPARAMQPITFAPMVETWVLLSRSKSPKRPLAGSST